MKALVVSISCPDILNIDVDILMSRRVKIEDLYQQQRAPDVGLCCRSARVQLALFYMLMLDTEPFVATFSAVPCHFMVLLQPQQITNTGRSCVTEACWSAVSNPRWSLQRPYFTSKPSIVNVVQEAHSAFILTTCDLSYSNSLGINGCRILIHKSINHSSSNNIQMETS